MKLIDSAKSHFESLGVQSIEVEEWKDEAGNPIVIYWTPITLSEKNKLFKKSDNLSSLALSMNKKFFVAVLSQIDIIMYLLPF